jgi:hypothetical protein
VSLKTRIRALEEHFGAAPDGLEPPHLCAVYVGSKAPVLNPGPIRWGTIPGIPKVFERRPDESEDDFVARLIALHSTPRERLIDITIHAETLKPEPPTASSLATFPGRGEARLR